MLRMLHDLSQKHWPLRLVVGHCDHRVRPDSAENAEHVRAAASGVLALPYMQVQADRQPGHWAEVRVPVWLACDEGWVASLPAYELGNLRCDLGCCWQERVSIGGRLLVLCPPQWPSCVMYCT